MVSTEQKALYNANRRRKYAERGEVYLATAARNAAYRVLNRESFNKQRADRRKTDPVWREEQNAKRRGRDQTETQLKTHYGLTKSQYEEMSNAQGGKCAICSKTPKEKLCVDHCHETGVVRALLCRSCNTGLGCFRDNPELLTKATKYLGGER